MSKREGLSAIEIYALGIIPELQLDKLIDIINATEKPTRCIEYLIGLITKPEVSDTTVNEKILKEKTDITFIGYNVILDRVEYIYKERNYKRVWIVKGSELPKYDDADLKTAEDYSKPSDEHELVYIYSDKAKTNAWTEYTYCSLETWNNV
jgi:hypothetical protein